jgi:hypothetical protein
MRCITVYDLDGSTKSSASSKKSRPSMRLNPSWSLRVTTKTWNPLSIHYCTSWRNLKQLPTKIQSSFLGFSPQEWHRRLLLRLTTHLLLRSRLSAKSHIATASSFNVFEVDLAARLCSAPVAALTFCVYDIILSFNREVVSLLGNSIFAWTHLFRRLNTYGARDGRQSKCSIFLCDILLSSILCMYFYISSSIDHWFGNRTMIPSMFETAFIVRFYW